jgi:hypothetical protein
MAGASVAIRKVAGAIEQIASPCFQQTPGAIARNAIKPGIERALTAKTLQSSICPDERLLSGVFGVGTIARIAHCQLDYPGAVPEHQPVEGLGFTGLGAAHETQIADIGARGEIGPLGIRSASLRTVTTHWNASGMRRCGWIFREKD